MARPFEVEKPTGTALAEFLHRPVKVDHLLGGHTSSEGKVSYPSNCLAKENSKGAFHRPVCRDR